MIYSIFIVRLHLRRNKLTSFAIGDGIERMWNTHIRRSHL